VSNCWFSIHQQFCLSYSYILNLSVVTAGSFCLCTHFALLPRFCWRCTSRLLSHSFVHISLSMKVIVVLTHLLFLLYWQFSNVAHFVYSDNYATAVPQLNGCACVCANVCIFSAAKSLTFNSLVFLFQLAVVLTAYLQWYVRKIW